MLTEKTIKFINDVKTLIESGQVKNYAEIIKALDWNKTIFSSVINGHKNVPHDIYKKFVEIYQPVNNNEDKLTKPDDKDKIIVEQAATIKKLQDDVSKLINLLQEANSLTLKPGYVSSILQPYLLQLAAGLANKQLNDADAVIKEFYRILGDPLGAQEKSGRYG